MNSKKCNNCGLTNFADVVICKKCKQSIVDNAAERLFDKSFATCGTCGSEDTQSVQMAFTTGVSFDSVAGLSHSLLAGIIHPPVEPNYRRVPNVDSSVGCFVSLLVICAIVAALILAQLSGVLAFAFFFAAVPIGIIYVLKMEKSRSVEQLSNVQEVADENHWLRIDYLRALAEWQRNWICLRCGANWKK